MTEKTHVVIYHSADLDGHMSGAIAREALEARGIEPLMIGWNYGDPVPEIPGTVQLFMLDVSIDELMAHPRLVWIDHHKTAIDKYRDVYGYQLDGVAACRLAWQFLHRHEMELNPDMFRNRLVNEPRIVQLVGEYDVWDFGNPDTEPLQYGLKAAGFSAETDTPVTSWDVLLPNLTRSGTNIMRYIRIQNADYAKRASMKLRFAGLTFVAANAFGNSTFFRDDPLAESADALMLWHVASDSGVRVSMYHAPNRTDLDLSQIAKQFDGGGHRGACGFTLSRHDMHDLLGGDIAASYRPEPSK